MSAPCPCNGGHSADNHSPVLDGPVTADRGPDGRSLGHSHVEQVQPPNRDYAGYYLPNLYQENYRITSAEVLDALPVGSIVVTTDREGGAAAYRKPHGRNDWHGERWLLSSNELTRDAIECDEWLFVVYRPDVVPARRDAA